MRRLALVLAATVALGCAGFMTEVWIDEVEKDLDELQELAMTYDEEQLYNALEMLRQPAREGKIGLMEIVMIKDMVEERLSDGDFDDRDLDAFAARVDRILAE